MATNSPTPIHRSDASRPRLTLFNGVLGLFAMALLAGIALSLHLSMLQPPPGCVVWGSSEVWRGHTCCFRAAVLAEASGELLPRHAITLSLTDSRGVRVQTTSAAAPVANVVLAVPVDLESDAWLDVDVTAPADNVEYGEHLRIPIQALDHPTPLRGHIAPWQTVLEPKSYSRAAVDVGAAKVGLALYPTSGELVGGLNNPVVARVTRNGAPWSTAVRQKALGLDQRSDAAGLVRFVLRPLPQSVPLIFHVGDDLTPVALTIVPQARQLQMLVNPAIAAPPSGSFEVHVDTLPFKGPVLLETWAGDLLLWSTTVDDPRGGFEAVIPAPQDYQGWVWLAAVRNLHNPQDSRSTALRWVGTSEEAGHAAAQLAGDDPLVIPSRSDPQLLPLLLSRFVPDIPGATQIINTVEARRTQFEATRNVQRQHIYWGMGAITAVGAALATVWVVTHLAGLRRRVDAVVQDSLDAGEDVDPHLARRLAQVRHVPYLILTLLALLLAGYGLFTLLEHMRWE